jgi:alpha-beta hydrolase superfamily lysophospholipase
LAAIIADPGQLDVGGKVLGPLAKMGLSPDAAAKLPHLGQGDEQRLMQVIDGNRELHWKVVQRGFWTNGAPDLTAWLVEMATWKLDDDLVAEIRCPTLVTAAESDPASSDARALYAALTCPKDFIPFYDADGAGMHCEMLNRSMANRTILDWLDDTLAGARR